jgi:hypothetical protein
LLEEALEQTYQTSDVGRAWVYRCLDVQTIVGEMYESLMTRKRVRPLVPEGMRPFLWILVWISAVGLVVSLCVHVGAVMGHKVVPDACFFILHIGIFVVWAPAVILSRRTVGIVDQRDFWKVMLNPSWMRYVVYAFMGYAFINFFFFISHVPRVPKEFQPPVALWRGFSGHWMAFYSAAFAVLYSAAQGSRRSVTKAPVEDDIIR